MRGVCIPYRKQGLIRFTCLDYINQPPHIRDKIDALCRACGGEYEQALRELVLTDHSVTGIAMRHNVSEATLYRRRKLFYESW